MTTYNFKAASWILFVLTPIISFIGGVLLIVPLINYGIFPPRSTTSFSFYLGGVILLVIYLTRLASFAKVEITLSGNSISIKWLQGFLFNHNPDITIHFSEIEEYVIQHDSNWDWLKVILTNEKVYRIWHSSFLFKDDFEKFIFDFKLAIEAYNENLEENISKNKFTQTPKKIYQGKTVYETIWGLILAGIVIIMIVGIPILFFIKPPAKTPNYWMLGILYVSAILFVFKIYSYRTRKNSAD